MDPEWVRRYCMGLPHTTETVQWGANLVFKVGGKMFLVAALEPGKHALSIKVSGEAFEQLQEIDGIVPAPYLARAKWLALRELNLLHDDEFCELIRSAHGLVLQSLPRSRREALAAAWAVEKAAKKQPKAAPPETH